VVEAEPLAVDPFVEKVVAVAAEVLTGRVIAELVVVAAVEKIESAYVEEVAVVAAAVVVIVASLLAAVVAVGELAERPVVEDAVASVACAASVPDTADDAAASP